MPVERRCHGPVAPVRPCDVEQAQWFDVSAKWFRRFCEMVSTFLRNGFDKLVKQLVKQFQPELCRRLLSGRMGSP
jgi:predicted component of type VI protein secretion system